MHAFFLKRFLLAYLCIAGMFLHGTANAATDGFQFVKETPESSTNTTHSNTNQKPACHKRVGIDNNVKSGIWCIRSQLPAQKKYSYGPENLSSHGAWCEGEEGHGKGVTVEMTFQPFDSNPPTFDRLLIENGNNKTLSTFLNNSRVKTIKIETTAGQTWIRTLKDKMDMQEVLFGEEINPYGMLITILEVYPGHQYDNTCLSYLLPKFKEIN